MREQETGSMTRVRTDFNAEFRLAERILDFGYALVIGRRIQNPAGDALVGALLLALYSKILANFWALIVLAERSLPSSSSMRELTEALISLVYVASKDSSARAETYRDYVPVRALKDMNRRWNCPDTRDTVTPEERTAVQVAIDDVARRQEQKSKRPGGRLRKFLLRLFRRVPPSVDKMRRWKTWAGDFSLEDMARRAGLPCTIYNLAYSTDSRAAHALDAADYLRADPDGTLQVLIPFRTEQHLIPACVAALVAMDQVGTKLGLNREVEMKALLDEAVRLSDEHKQKRIDGREGH